MNNSQIIYAKMKHKTAKWVLGAFVMLWFSTTTAQTKVTLTFQNASTQEIEVNSYGKIYFSDNYMYIDDGTALPYSFAVSEIRKMAFSEVLDVHDIVAEAFKVYPNPTHNDLYVSGEDYGPYPYALYSIDGRLLMHGEVGNGESIHTNHIPTGLYILKINNTSIKISKL